MKETGPIRVVFMGTGPFAVPSLKYLRSWTESREGRAFAVVGIVTQPDRTAGRGRTTSRGAIAQLGDTWRIPVLQPMTFRDDDAIAVLAEQQADVFVVASYGLILPRQVLALPTRGCLNLHPSLLPRHRGPSPIPAAILGGDEETGISVMEMVANMDAGPVVTQRRLHLTGTETTAELTPRLSELNAQLLCEALPKWFAGKIDGREQDDSEATYTSMLTKDMGRIDWTNPAEVLERQVRAFNPWPRAATSILGQPVHIWQARLGADRSNCEPGTILRADKTGIEIRAGEGSLSLEEIQPAGSRRMPASAFVNSHPVLVGSVAE